MHHKRRPQRRSDARAAARMAFGESEFLQAQRSIELIRVLTIVNERILTDAEWIGLVEHLAYCTSLPHVWHLQGS